MSWILEWELLTIANYRQEFDSMKLKYIALLFTAGMLSAKDHKHEQKPETLFTPAEIAKAMEPAPKDFGKVDVAITMGVIHGQLKYSVERIAAKPNAGIRIIFANNDEMPHNFLLCKPGKGVAQEMGLAAAALGEDGPKKKYIPKTDKILFASDVIQPGKIATLYFKAPKDEGDYPFVCTLPGHFATMKGTLFVRKDLRKVPNAPPPPKKGQFFLPVSDKPYVYRSTIPGVGPDAIAVGTPQGIHYAFDPHTCRLALAWSGDFLDVKRDWAGRGGQGTGIPGKTFYRTKVRQILMGDASAKFRGYRMVDDLPVFLYSIGSAQVEHSLLPLVDGSGVLQQITIRNASKSVTFVNDAKWTSPGNTFENEKLTFAPAKAISFQVALRK